MAWSCRSHSPPWSQIGQSSGWLISRNSITPSRALRTIGERVVITLGVPSRLGGRSRTPMAQEACGFGIPCTSIRHMRQFPAIDSRSWKQKRGISAPPASHACNSVYSGGTSISLPSTMSLVIPVPSHRSCASCRLPELRGRQTFPAKGIVARSMPPEVLEPFDRFLNRWNMARRHPPHHEIGPLRLFEPFLPPSVEALVHRLPDIGLQRGNALPHRHVDRHARITPVWAIAGGVAARILQSPHKTFGPISNRIDSRKVVHEVGHARVVDLVAQASDVELSEMLHRLGSHCSTPLLPPRRAQDELSPY